MASIHIIQGPDKGRTFDLSESGTAVGRQDADVELTDNTVSRQHLRLARDSGTWMLSDLGSANGTYLNGVRLKRPVALHPGDQIRCGRTLLVFTQTGQVGDALGGVDVDENGKLVDAAIVATVPSNEDSVIIPTPEAGAQAIGNLRIIYDLISEIGSIFDVDLVLQRTLDKVFEVLKADRGFIILIDKDDGGADRQKLVLKASRFAVGSERQEIPISRTIITEVMRNEVGVLSSNAMGDKRFAAGKSVHNFSIRSAICVPIKGHHEILGVIHVDSSVSEHTYSTEQLRLLTAIGYQVGMMVENVRLYQAAVQSERLAAVGETVAVLSHHVKNILQALAAGTDVVEMALNGDDMDKAKKAWPIVQRGLGRTNDLILNMLAFSKDRQPHRGDVNTNAVLEECLELIGPRADELGVAVMTELDDLPPIPAEADGLQHAFLNLLTNALDAVEPKRGAVTVKSSYNSLTHRVIVQIIDNGSGIAAEHLPLIFHPFFSAKGQQGTGLGLAVARKIFDEHGGDVTVDSTPDEGTTFTVSLPAMITGDPNETIASDGKWPAGEGRMQVRPDFPPSS